MKINSQTIKIDHPLELVLDSISDGVLIADENGIVIYVNTAYCKITNVECDKIILSKVTDSRPGTKLPEVLATGKEIHGLRRRVGSIEYITDIMPIFVDDKIMGAISIVRDITSIIQLSNELNIYSNQVKKLQGLITNSYKTKYSLSDIIGSGPAISKVKEISVSLAKSPMPVLITGESGVGKELFAHAIHNLSDRHNEPFVAVNCAAFPPNLLLSELFGYEEGSFTGASKGGKIGFFEIANMGTLFLDEIGDMEMDLQAKILRVLEMGEFTKIGCVIPIKTDIRIISATNKNLEQLILEKKFRNDLYYRLNVAALEIPPLRDRHEDIIELAEYFLERISRLSGKKYRFSHFAKLKLAEHDYPGNVRELLNVISLSACICISETIQADDLIFNKANTAPILNYEEQYRPEPVVTTLKAQKEIIEKQFIKDFLTRHGHSVRAKKELAKAMNISLATLYNRLREYR